jgi:hypothetical protein
VRFVSIDLITPSTPPLPLIEEVMFTVRLFCANNACGVVLVISLRGVLESIVELLL